MPRQSPRPSTLSLHVVPVLGALVIVASPQRALGLPSLPGAVIVANHDLTQVGFDDSQAAVGSPASAVPVQVPPARSLDGPSALDPPLLPVVTAPPPEDDRLERLGIAGGLMLGKAYMLTITIATGALVACWADPHGSVCLLPESRPAWYDLYIPVAGPFVALRHQDVRDNLAYALSFGALGTAQTVGLALVTVGLLAWDDDEGATHFFVTPQVARGYQGFALSGRF